MTGVNNAVFLLVIGVMLASFSVPSVAYGVEVYPPLVYEKGVALFVCDDYAHAVWVYSSVGTAEARSAGCGTVFAPLGYSIPVGDMTVIEVDPRFQVCTAACSPLAWTRDPGFVGLNYFTVSAGEVTPASTPASTPVSTPAPATIRSNGIELIGDDGEIYCVRVVRGRMTSAPGGCSGEPTTTSSPEEQGRTPEPDASAEPDVSAEPDASPEPDASLEPEAASGSVSDEELLSSPSDETLSSGSVVPGLPETGGLGAVKNNPWPFALAMGIFAVAGVLSLRKYLADR